MHLSPGLTRSPVQTPRSPMLWLGLPRILSVLLEEACAIFLLSFYLVLLHKLLAQRSKTSLGKQPPNLKLLFYILSSGGYWWDPLPLWSKVWFKGQLRPIVKPSLSTTVLLHWLFISDSLTPNHLTGSCVQSNSPYICIYLP